MQGNTMTRTHNDVISYRWHDELVNYKHVKLLIFVLMTPFYINESYNLLILLANKMYAKV